jgi:hypothetical protein
MFLVGMRMNYQFLESFEEVAVIPWCILNQPETTLCKIIRRLRTINQD